VVVSDGPSSTNVDVLFGASDAAGNNVFFHPYGYSAGSFNFFGSRASGGGVFDATSTLHLHDVVSAVGAPQDYIFDFVVDAGELAADCAPCTGGGTASIDIVIKLDAGNDNTVDQTFSGNASLVVNSDGSYSFTRTGLAAQLNGISGDDAGGAAPVRNLFYGWSSTGFSLNLGSFGAGDTFRLDYDLVARATGAFTGSTSIECTRDQGFHVEFPADEIGANVADEDFDALGIVDGGEGGNFFCTGWTPGTRARAGDPGGLPNGNPFGIRAADVDEPGSIALLGLGMFGLAGLAGRRRKA
jgi:hypothetical protein